MGAVGKLPIKFSECFSSSIEYTLLPTDILSAHICRKWKLHLCHWFQMLLNKYILHNLHVYNGEMFDYHDNTFVYYQYVCSLPIWR